MVINHNISAINAHRNFTINESSLKDHIRKLASGLRIERAGDDPAGLAVSEKMRAQIRGLNQATRNIGDDISFIQTTEGYLQSSQDLLHRIRELAVQSANGTYTFEDRYQIQVEVSQLVDEIDRIASHAQFNTLNMLTGRFATGRKGAATASMWFHIGANMDHRERIYIGTMTAAALGVKAVNFASIISLRTQDDSNRALATLDTALYRVSRQRADLGAIQNRLEFAVKSVMTGAENMQASESHIRDADMALEMTDFVKRQILSQSSIMVLQQSNAKSQMVLRLLS